MINPKPPSLMVMELPERSGSYWPALKFASYNDMRMWGKKLQNNRNQSGLGDLLVQEATRHAGCCSKRNISITSFPLYADLLMEKSRENGPCKSLESASPSKPKFRAITDDTEHNLRHKYDSEKDILTDLESALSALGAMQKLGCRFGVGVGTAVVPHSSPMVPTCSLTETVIASSRSSPIQHSQAVESDMVSDSSVTEQQETGGGDSPSEQDEIMSYDGEGVHNYRHCYENDEEDGQTDQESPFPDQTPEAVWLLWNQNKLWSVLKKFGWRKKGLYYRPNHSKEPFNSWSDVVSFCAMNIDDKGDGMSLWNSSAQNEPNICTNQESFLLWGTLLPRLRVAGWTIEYYDTRLKGKFSYEAYLRPGVKPGDKGLVHNLHYFQDQETVRAFVRQYWDNPEAWLGHYKDVEGLEAVMLSDKRRRSSDPATIASKYMRTTEGKNSVLSLPRDEVSASKHARAESKASHGKRSVFFSQSWDEVWKRLTRGGRETGAESRRSARVPVWTYKDQILGNKGVYFRPGCEGKVIASLKEGIHYFTLQHKVRQFCADHEHGDKFMEQGLISTWNWEKLRDSGWKHLYKKTTNIISSTYEDWYLRPCNEFEGIYWDDQLAARLGLRKNLHYFTTKDAVEDFLRINSDIIHMLETGDYTMPAVSADGEYMCDNVKTLATPDGKAAAYVPTKDTNNTAMTIHSKSITNHDTTHQFTPSPVMNKGAGKNPTTYSKKKISSNSQQRVAPESLLQLDSPTPSITHRVSPQDPHNPRAAQPMKNPRSILLARGWYEEEGGKVLVRPECGTGCGWILGKDYFYEKDDQHLLDSFLKDNPELLLTGNALAGALQKKGWTCTVRPQKWMHPSGTAHLGEGTFDTLKAVEFHIHRFPIVLCGENNEAQLLDWLRARGWEEDEAPSEDGSGKLRRGYQILSRSEVYRLAYIKPTEVALPQAVEGRISQKQGSPKWIDSPQYDSAMENAPLTGDSVSSWVNRDIEGAESDGDFEFIMKLVANRWEKGDNGTWTNPCGQNFVNLDTVHRHLKQRSNSLSLLHRASNALQLGCEYVNEKNFMCTRTEYKELKKRTLQNTRSRKGGSLLLSGLAGSGKTLAASILEGELEMTKEKPPPVCLHLQGTASVSSKAVFQDLGDQLERKGGGCSEDSSVSSAEEHLMRELHVNPSSACNTKVPMVIVVVDEIDCLDSCALQHLFAWAHSDGSRLILIGITNNVNLPNEPIMEFQRNRGWKSEHITFPSYDKDALLEILRHRVGFAVEQTAIEFCAKWAIKSGCGSARLALTLLLQAVGIAKADADISIHSESFPHPVRVEHVRTAVRTFNNAGLPTAEAIVSLPLQAKIILCVAAWTAAVEARHKRASLRSTYRPDDKGVETESSLIISEDEMERAVLNYWATKFSGISTEQYRDTLNTLQNAAMIKRKGGGSSRSGSTKLNGSPPKPTDNVEILVPVYLIKQAVSNNPTCIQILS